MEQPAFQLGLDGPVAFVVGLVLLIGASEPLLKGATRMAAALGVRPLVIGLTVVALGTSTPELAVGITAALQGNGGLAVGNIAGANVVVLLLVLGLSALLVPLPLHLRVLRLELPAIIVAAVLMTILAADGVLTRLDGALLLAVGILYTVVLIRVSRGEVETVKAEFAESYPVASGRTRRGGVAGNGLVILLALTIIVIGAELLVNGAVDVARSVGVSDAVIGLTIVALGTSAPELVTTLVGTIRGERDVAVGNLLGSAAYNILVILAITCLASPDGLPVEVQLIIVDIPIMTAVALLCIPVFVTGSQVSRKEGALFVAMYVAYLVSIVALRT